MYNNVQTPYKLLLNGCYWATFYYFSKMGLAGLPGLPGLPRLSWPSLDLETGGKKAERLGPRSLIPVQPAVISRFGLVPLVALTITNQNRPLTHRFLYPLKKLLL